MPLKSLPSRKEGFAPLEALFSTLFKTAAIDHSAIAPMDMTARAVMSPMLPSIRPPEQLHQHSDLRTL